MFQLELEKKVEEKDDLLFDLKVHVLFNLRLRLNADV